MKRFLKVVGIFMLFAVALSYFAFRILFFDPFEDEFPVLDQVVPRDVDFALRRRDLEIDFNPFPTPDFWLGLRIQPEWQDFTETTLYRELEARFDFAGGMEELEQSVAEMKPLKPLADFLAREAMVVGRLREDGTVAGAVLVRGSFRAKLLAEAVGLGPLRKLAGDQVQEFEKRDGIASLTLADGSTMHLLRRRDVLVAGNDRELISEIRERADGTGVALADTLQYRSVVLNDPSEIGRPLDFAVDVRGLARHLGWEEIPVTPVAPPAWHWLAKALRPDKFEMAAGRLSLGDEMDLRLKVEVSPDELRAQSGGLFSEGSGDLAEMYRFCGTYLPEDVFAFASLRLDVAAMLRALEAAFNEDARDLLGEFVLRVRRRYPDLRVTGVADILDRVGRALGDEMILAFEQNAPYRIPQSDEVQVPEPGEGPRVAALFPMADRTTIELLIDRLVGAARTGVPGTVAEVVHVWQWSYDENTRFREIDFGLPDTPSLAVGILEFQERPFLVLTTTGQFLNEIVQNRYRVLQGYDGGLSRSVEYQRGADVVEGFGQGIAFVSTKRLLRALEEMTPIWAADATRPDYVTLRAEALPRVLRERFPELVGRPLPESRREEIERILKTEMDEVERRWLAEEVPAAEERYRRDLAAIRLLHWLALTYQVHERDLELRVRLATPARFR